MTDRELFTVGELRAAMKLRHTRIICNSQSLFGLTVKVTKRSVIDALDMQADDAELDLPAWIFSNGTISI